MNDAPRDEAYDPTEDDLFLRFLRGTSSPDEYAAFVDRLRLDDNFRERFADFYAIKAIFVPAMRAALQPPEHACNDVRKRFQGAGKDAELGEHAAADTAHVKRCPSCALARIVFEATSPSGRPGVRRKPNRGGPPVAVLLVAIGLSLVLGRTNCGEAPVETKRHEHARPVLIAAAEDRPSVATALSAVRDPALADEVRIAADLRRDPEQRRQALDGIVRAGKTDAGAIAWALATEEPSPEFRRRCYSAADRMGSAPLSVVVAALQSEMTAAEPANIDVLLALLRRHDAAPARALLLDLVTMAAGRPGSFAEITQVYDQALFALPDDAEVAALVTTAAASDDRSRAAVAQYALAAHAFANGDDAGLDAALAGLAPELEAADNVVANRAALAFERFSKSRHLAAVEAQGVNRFAVRWKIVIEQCAARGVSPVPQS